jgi:hypothetical protein
MSRFVLPLVVALCLATPATAVIVTTAPGAPDPGMAPGETMLVTFDAPNVAGVTSTFAGPVITAAGSTGGVRAAPAGTVAGGVYRSIGRGGSSLFDFSGWSGGRPLATASLYWGSVDAYNFLDVLNASGGVVRTIAGSDLPMFNGNQTLPMTNRRVFLNFDAAQNVTALRMRSTGAAFEFDNIAASAAVPEPASWALLITGFGLIGYAMRRRQAHSQAA